MGKKSNRTKLKEQLLERDNSLCGVHSGGCRKHIESVEDANIDHIIPKSFIRFLPNAEQFNPNLRIDLPRWNLQPMHPSCNSNRGGQLISEVQFKCGCHHNFIDTNSDRYVCYREDEAKDPNWDNDNMRWRKYFYSGEAVLGDESLVNDEPIIADNPFRFKICADDGKGGRTFEDDVIIIPKRIGQEKIGFGLYNKVGHLIWSPRPFHRIQLNMGEMFRCHRWRRAFAEGESFMQMLKDTGREHLHRQCGYGDLHVVANVLFMMDISKKYIGEGFIQGSATILNETIGKRWVYIPLEILDMPFHTNPEEWGKIMKEIEYETVRYARHISQFFIVNDASDRGMFLTHLAELERELKRELETEHPAAPPSQHEPAPGRAERRRQRRKRGG